MKPTPAPRLPFGFRFVDDREGLLPDEIPSLGRLVLFSLQQFIVMFPATVLVALLTGFHVSTTIFASGFATICFVFVTRGAIPLYYGSSFSYIAAIVAITGAREFGQVAPDALIGQAQFGIIMSGLVSIAAGFVIDRSGKKHIERILPAEVTGPVAIVIGITLAGVAMQGAAGNWPIAAATLLATILASVLFRGFAGQLPVLFGIAVGYGLSLAAGIVDFAPVASADTIRMPHFTLPVVSWTAVGAIMPIAVATIPESTAHLFQIDLYVNKLAERRKKARYDISSKLGVNLIGDGVGDIVSSLFGGPAGTNYGENISTMAVTRVFSVPVIVGTAVLAVVFSFLGKFAAAVNTIPGPVIGGLSIYLFGVIAVQGVGIMVEHKVDLFDNRTLAIIATILVIGIGGTFAFPGGMIPAFGAQLPAIATAAVWGILLNLVLGRGKKRPN